ncbi:MAG: CRISPR-associated endonuclease Cas1 [Gemmatimonadetes bacterium]|nr:CRISPR-associated endonuclease Cas1 [Gemmatimonadota bacterium]
MPTLYLTTPGACLAARSQTLVVRRRGHPSQRVPLLAIERVAVLAPTQLTSAALAMCARHQIEIVVVCGRRPPPVMVRLCTSEAGLALRGAQFRAAADPAFTLGLARTVVAGKIRNQRRYLQRSRTGGETTGARAALQELLDRVETAETLNQLRGIEGQASAVYFGGLRSLVNPEYGFETRNRRPPRDPANALLSFAYTLLTSEATAYLAANGLEPALGFFHEPHRGRPSLALDLVEEFRTPVADALVVQVCSRRIVRPAEFRPGPNGGVRMSPAARRRFIQAYESKMDGPFNERSGEQTTLRAALRRQAERLTLTIGTGEPYVPFELP